MITEANDAGAHPLAAAFAATTPKWAGGYTMRREADGRMVLHAEFADSYVYVIPKAWMKMDPAAYQSPGAAPNYGLQMGGIQARSGHLETNDPQFGRELLAGARTGTGSEAPLPLGPTSSRGPDLTVPCGLLAVGAVLVALIVRIKRKAS